MMFTMWPSLECFSDSLRNIDTFDNEDGLSLPYRRPPSKRPRYVETSTQTDNFNGRQSRCHRVTLAMIRGSCGFELCMQLKINVKQERRSIWLEAANTVCALFSACYQPIILTI